MVGKNPVSALRAVPALLELRMEYLNMKLRTRKQRRRALKKLPYKVYLKTRHWKTTRRKALKFYGEKCAICSGKRDLHVHHKSYKNRGREAMRDLQVLCAGCHGEKHGREGLSEVDKEFRQIASNF